MTTTAQAEQWFEEIDYALQKLGKSDSSIEYARHLREPFNEIVSKLNNLKRDLGVYEKPIIWYFE